ncbi:helix-turn-helix domain-containing protein [Nocardioides hwasunensis]|uniref:Helix-turn-helix domain-containing protein n=1 Tax=Nocardioides hwasunensis TaxID=397258 RepID=A0ABR8MG73_9ACTN|nr:helix-turn-helix domain-containing protein [Nocardioides hwasunensis]
MSERHRPTSPLVSAEHHHSGGPVTAQPHTPSPRRDAGDEILTLQEACSLLRVPEGTLRYWRHLGCGPRSFKIGRHVRYWRADLTLWLAEQTNRPQDHH